MSATKPSPITRLRPYIKTIWGTLAPLLVVLAGDFLQNGDRLTWTAVEVAVATAIVGGGGVLSLSNKTPDGRKINQPEPPYAHAVGVAHAGVIPQVDSDQQAPAVDETGTGDSTPGAAQ